MPRVKINQPASFFYKTSIEIGVGHLNYGNHLSNEHILSFAHEARLRFFTELGATEFDFWGTGLIQSDAEIVYKSEGHYQDVIDVYIDIAELSRVGFRVNYLMSNRTTGKDLAIAAVGIVCFNYAQKKVQDLPIPFKEYLDSIEKIIL